MKSFEGYLTEEEIEMVVKAFVNTSSVEYEQNTTRRNFLNGINLSYVREQLEIVGTDPIKQLRNDLSVLNSTESITDDKVPLWNWLKAAERKFETLQTQIIFTNLLKKVPSKKSFKPDNPTDKSLRMSPSLIKVRNFSRIASSDANLVIENVSEEQEITLENIYVTRLIEEEILGRIHEDNPKLITIVGEAGHGKTSLLWNIHKTLTVSKSLEPWFIKSSTLLQAEKDSDSELKYNFSLSSEQIIEATVNAMEQGIRPISMFDTVDLLLHNEFNRTLFIQLISKLMSIGCPVLATCRPQEAVLLRPVEPVRINLKPYDDRIKLPSGETELSEAVRKHIKRFCFHYSQEDQTKQLILINEAVTQGRPLREVCINPLSLRMLFDIYRPTLISSEINIFQLYNDYWESRVISDYRTGNPEKFIESKDLSSEAIVTALTMLAEGTPEINVGILEKGFLQFASNKTDSWKDLIGRNILQKSALKTISFFHQTFFEYASATGLLKYLGKDSLTLIEERLKQTPHDLFIGPIYEQLLLLAGLETINIRKAADQKLINLLESGLLSVKLSGIYIYCHRERVTPEHEIAVIKNLQSGDSVIVDKYLETIPNIHASRLKNTFKEFDAIWNREIVNKEKDEKWREQEHLLDLLPRFVARDPQGVKEFLSRNDIPRIILSKPLTFSGDRKLIRLIGLLANYEPDWCFNQLIEFFINSAPRTKNSELQTVILKEIYNHTDIWKFKDIASRISPALKVYKDGKPKNYGALAEIYSNFWIIEWENSNKDLETILQEILTAPDNIELRAKFKALAKMLLKLEASQINKAWEHFLKIEDSSKHWLWNNQIWSVLISDRAEKSEYDDDGHSTNRLNKSPSQEWLINKISSRLRISLIENRAEETSFLLQILHNAEISNELNNHFLSNEYFMNAAPWLSKEFSHKLLTQSFLAGHPGAVKAVEQLIEKPNEYLELISLVNSKLINFLIEIPDSISILLKLTIAAEDANSINRVLGLFNSQSLPDVFFMYRDELEKLQNRLTESIKSSERNLGIQLWEKLLQNDLVSVPNFALIKDKIEKETVADVKIQLIILMNTALTKGSYDIAEIFEFLFPLAISKTEGIRRVALQGLIKSIIQAQVSIEYYAERILLAVLAPPTDAERIGLFRLILEKLISNDINLAVTLLLKIATEAESSGLGINGKRKVFSRFQKTTREIARFATDKLKEAMLDSVPNLDRHFGALLVESICLESYTSVKAQLENLLNDTNVPSDVKKIIIRFKFSQERIVGNDGWKEIYSLLNFQFRHR